MTAKHWLPTLVLLRLALGSAAAGAANLLQNGTFDTNTTGWTNVAVFDGTRGNPAGSDRVAVTSTGGTACTDSIQCVPISGGLGYDASADILVASALTTAPGTASVTFIWSSDPACANLSTTSLGSFAIGPATNANALDQWLHFDSGVQIAPPGARSLFVAPNPCADAAGTFTANYDNLVLQQAPITAVPTLSSTSLLVLGLGLVAAALLLLARRPG